MADVGHELAAIRFVVVSLRFKLSIEPEKNILRHVKLSVTVKARAENSQTSKSGKFLDAKQHFCDKNKTEEKFISEDSRREMLSGKMIQALELAFDQFSHAEGIRGIFSGLRVRGSWKTSAIRDFHLAATSPT